MADDSQTLKAMHHQIDKIELEPKTSGCTIELKILVDGVQEYQKAVKAKEALSWENVLERGVWENSNITIILHKTTWYRKSYDVSISFPVGVTGDHFRRNLENQENHKNYAIQVNYTTRQLGEEETKQFIGETLQAIHEIARELEKNNFERTRDTIINAFRSSGDKIKFYYRIVRLFADQQDNILKGMMYGLRTSKLLSRPAAKTIQMYDLARHDLDDKIFFIQNCKYGTEAKVDVNKLTDTLKASISEKGATLGRKWLFSKPNGGNPGLYTIRSVDHGDRNTFAVGEAGEVTLSHDSHEIWWTLKPVGDIMGHYIIHHRTQDLCWSMEGSGIGTPIVLKKCVEKDTAYHWQLQLCEDY